MEKTTDEKKIQISENIANEIIIQEYKKNLEIASIKKNRFGNWSTFLSFASRMFIIASPLLSFLSLAYEYKILIVAASSSAIISGVTNEIINLLNKNKDIQTAKYNELLNALGKTDLLRDNTRKNSNMISNV